MALLSLGYCSLALLLSTRHVIAQSLSIDSALIGTWTTKSRQVLTGSGFYDPRNETIFEPRLTGISYSFTDDGHYEEAYYRAVPNPVKPACPQGIIQWQHGSFVQKTDGSLALTPFAVDGRQLLSDPCNNENAVYTRYNQSEIFVRYERSIDPHNNQQRLDLYQWDGAPMNPMWLAFKPPEMLPTTVLNSIDMPTPSTKVNQAVRMQVRQNSEFDVMHKRSETTEWTAKKRWFWLGLASTGLSGVLFMVS